MFWTIVGALLFVFVVIPLLLSLCVFLLVDEAGQFILGTLVILTLIGIGLFVNAEKTISYLGGIGVVFGVLLVWVIGTAWIGAALESRKSKSVHQIETAEAEKTMKRFGLYERDDDGSNVRFLGEEQYPSVKTILSEKFSYLPERYWPKPDTQQLSGHPDTYVDWYGNLGVAERSS